MVLLNMQRLFLEYLISVLSHRLPCYKFVQSGKYPRDPLSGDVITLTDRSHRARYLIYFGKPDGLTIYDHDCNNFYQFDLTITPDELLNKLVDCLR